MVPTVIMAKTTRIWWDTSKDLVCSTSHQQLCMNLCVTATIFLQSWLNTNSFLWRDVHHLISHVTSERWTWLVHCFCSGLFSQHWSFLFFYSNVWFFWVMCTSQIYAMYVLDCSWSQINGCPKNCILINYCHNVRVMEGLEKNSNVYKLGQGPGKGMVKYVETYV